MAACLPEDSALAAFPLPSVRFDAVSVRFLAARVISNRKSTFVCVSRCACWVSCRKRIPICVNTCKHQQSNESNAFACARVKTHNKTQQDVSQCTLPVQMHWIASCTVGVTRCHSGSVCCLEQCAHASETDARVCIRHCDLAARHHCVF